MVLPYAYAGLCEIRPPRPNWAESYSCPTFSCKNKQIYVEISEKYFVILHSPNKLYKPIKIAAGDKQIFVEKLIVK